MRIVFVNLLNNFSGSPNVLSVVVRGLVMRKHQVEIITNRSSGFLSDIPGVRYKYIHYQWSKQHRITSLLTYIFAQLELFFLLLTAKRQDTVYYLNTIAPVGALIGCKLSKKRFYIHVHENMKQRKVFYGIYRFVYKYCNEHSIFVSKYVQSQALNVRNSIVAYNGLNEDFLKTAIQCPSSLSERYTILMLCSLAPHKGINEFIALAQKLSRYKFELVVNDCEKVVKEFTEKNKMPANLEIFSSQTNVHNFYRRAKIVLNLSRPDSWVETFGLTLLEGMTYGIPVIGPPVGGPCEIIEDGVDGYLINSACKETIKEKIVCLMTDDKLYSTMSEKAKEKAFTFSSTQMIEKIEKYLLQSGI